MTDPTAFSTDFHLDGQASRHFKFRQLIECGETFFAKKPERTPLPQNPESWAMLRGLAQFILDPVVDEFGPIEVTYGFGPEWLTRWIRGRIKPDVDQHALCEVKQRSGLPICARGGAAVDFRVPGRSTAEVVIWAISHVPCIPIDRLYYYGSTRPLHISWSPTPGFLLYHMREYTPGRLMPRQLKREALIEELSELEREGRG